VTNLFLIGYRGAGKSTLARLLAPRLHWQARDTDEIISSSLGKGIAEIFQLHGEAFFRDREHGALVEVCRHQHQVVATGGGIVVREENRLLMRQSGRMLWLQAPAHVLSQRIERDAAGRRPPLTGLAPQDELEVMLHQREPLYAALADFVLDAGTLSPQDMVEAALRLLEQSR
jgi:shikimate kinase